MLLRTAQVSDFHSVTCVVGGEKMFTLSCTVRGRNSPFFPEH